MSPSIGQPDRAQCSVASPPGPASPLPPLQVSPLRSLQHHLHTPPRPLLPPLRPQTPAGQPAHEREGQVCPLQVRCSQKKMQGLEQIFLRRPIRQSRFLSHRTGVLPEMFQDKSLSSGSETAVKDPFQYRSTREFEKSSQSFKSFLFNTP